MQHLVGWMACLVPQLVEAVTPVLVLHQVLVLQGPHHLECQVDPTLSQAHLV